MHAGVIRDVEQQRIKKERQLDFEMQRNLEQEYRKIQRVSDPPVGDGIEAKAPQRRDR
jgi:protein PET117